MMRNSIRNGAVIAALLIVAGCVPIPPERAADTSAPVASPTAAQRVGIPAVDRVITAGLAGGAEGLRPLLRYLTTPCTTREGLGGPPKCAAGEAEGTPVEVFPLGGPEGTFLRAGEPPAFLPSDITGLYGVYRAALSPRPEPYWPGGEYGVVFTRSNGQLLDLRVSEEGIVRVDFTPPGIEANWWASAAEAWVVGPGGE